MLRVPGLLLPGLYSLKHQSLPRLWKKQLVGVLENHSLRTMTALLNKPEGESLLDRRYAVRRMQSGGAGRLLLPGVGHTYIQFPGRMASSSYKLPKEEAQKRFLQILKARKNREKSLDEDTFGDVSDRLCHLEKIGFKLYQVMEYPQVLWLSKTEINVRVVRLKRSMGGSDISVPMLKFASNNSLSLVRAQVQSYVKMLDGCSCVADFWIKKLNCTEEQGLDLMESNHHLMSRVGDIHKISQKLDLLVQYGARLEDVHRSSHVLINHTFETIEKRCKELQAAELGIPLPVKWIAQAERVYQKLVERYLAKKANPYPSVQKIAELLAVPAEELLKISPLHDMHWGYLEPKLIYLSKNKGYSAEDILAMPYVLEMSLQKIKNAVEVLESLGMEQPELRQVKNLIISGKIRSKRASKGLLAQLLECDTDNLANLGKELALLNLQTDKNMKRNLDFLLKCGFTKRNLLACPLLLGHDPELLEKHWISLPKSMNPVSFEKWQKEPEKLVNLLQYQIEKEHNFKYSVIL